MAPFAIQLPLTMKFPLKSVSRLFELAFILALAIATPRLYAQGPPYQTDDPVPVDYGHYEFYIFGGADGTPVEMDSTGPAFEFNWGAIPRVQLHAILPFGVAAPLNSPVYAPASGQGPTEFGLTDMELGTKIAFIKETPHFPQIGIFPMYEMPTGSLSKGLGVGKVWYKLPLWMQKNWGKWLFDGGAGYQLVQQAGFRSFPYTGWLVKKELNEQLELGAEVFAHGREGIATAQTQSATLIDAGGYYHFKRNPNEQFLFCYGHSVAGQTENYAYVGMYWTWGKDKGKPDKSALMPGPPEDRSLPLNGN
jgi:Putative MetA-pathway of phenol degradation